MSSIESPAANIDKTCSTARRRPRTVGFPPSTEGNPRPYGMPPFYQDLSDTQVAAVVTYLRQSWGNSAPPTWPVEVERSRGVPAD